VRVEKQRALPAFSKLRIDGPLDVRVQQASANQAVVVTDDNIEPLIESVVEGDTLVLRLKRDAGFTARRAPSIRLDARGLQSVSVEGSATWAMDHFKGRGTDAVAVPARGNARPELMELRELNVTITGFW
jgi:hypothetical protein